VCLQSACTLCVLMYRRPSPHVSHYDYTAHLSTPSHPACQCLREYYSESLVLERPGRHYHLSLDASVLASLSAQDLVSPVLPVGIRVIALAMWRNSAWLRRYVRLPLARLYVCVYAYISVCARVRVHV